MKNRTKDSLFICAILAAALLIVGGAIGIGWYDASVQAEVWRREGVEITTWEVYRGAKPVERAIIEKKDK